jgi:hypothetical protein
MLSNVINHRAANSHPLNHFILNSTHHFIAILFKMPSSKENRLQMAISAYKKGQIKSRNYAAKAFAVAESTLRERLHGIKARTETRVNGHRLTHIEKKVLIK